MTRPAVRRDPFHLAGVVLEGRFRVEREVAEGGFGVVYHATQIALDRPVALKVLRIPAGMDADARTHFHESFAAEARTVARIRHPNIVDVHDFGVSRMPSGEFAPWMVLEWLDGRTLEQYLTTRRGQGGQTPANALALLRPVLRAFAYAHREGVVHRDIKPANIMMTLNDSGARTTQDGLVLRILDFGIAKIVTTDESTDVGPTRTRGMPAFSPAYAAPEQVAFGRTGPWTDVHALGLMIAEILLDQPPYQAVDMQVFEEVLAATRPTPGARGRNVGPWEEVLAKALAFSPRERWKDAGELLAALESTVEAATADKGAPTVTVDLVQGPPPVERLADTTQLLRAPEDPTRAGETSIPRVGIAGYAALILEHSRRWPRVILVLAGAVLAIALGSWFASSLRHTSDGFAQTAPAVPNPQPARAPVPERAAASRAGLTTTIVSGPEGGSAGSVTTSQVSPTAARTSSRPSIHAGTAAQAPAALSQLTSSRAGIASPSTTSSPENRLHQPGAREGRVDRSADPRAVSRVPPAFKPSSTSSPLPRRIEIE